MYVFWVLTCTLCLSRNGEETFLGSMPLHLVLRRPRNSNTSGSFKISAPGKDQTHNLGMTSQMTFKNRALANCATDTLFFRNIWHIQNYSQVLLNNWFICTVLVKVRQAKQAFIHDWTLLCCYVWRSQRFTRTCSSVWVPQAAPASQ